MKLFLRRLFLWSPFVFFLVYVFNFQPVKSSSGTPPSGTVKDPVSNVSCARSGCHDTYSPFNLNRATVTIGTTSGNQVPLNGFQYTGSTLYIINFSVISPSSRSGFEMSALTTANATAGTFARTNTTNTTLQTSTSGIQYIGHKSASSTSTWSFNWTSPATTAGNITFYSAINKSNSNNSDTGDSIFHQTFVITPLTTLSVDAGNNVSVCPGTSTQLQAAASNTSGTTYAWSPSAGLSCTNCANPMATPGSTTTYTVTATNNGQTASDNVTVTTYNTAAPVINSAANSICPGNVLSLTSSGFSTYSWSTGSSAASAQVTAGGTYILTVTDANGCSTTASKTITQGQTPVTSISSTQPYLCGSNSTVLSAGNFSSYLWSNNSTASTITALQAGSYAVTVTNATGCTASAAYTLTGYALPVANVTANGPQTFCNGGSVVLTANSGTAYTYKWSTGATTAAITVSQSGAYRVTVYNPCDSAVSQVQNVVVNTTPVAQVSPAGSVLLCNNGSQTINATPQGLNYTWLKDGVIVNGQQADSLVVSAAGNYNVIVSQGSCADTSQTVAVSIGGAGNAPVDIIASQLQLCNGDVATLDAGAGFTTYTWLPGNSTAQTLQITTGGTYIVHVTASNGQCSSTGADTIIITQGNSITAPALTYDSTVCNGSAITVYASPSNYSSYLWSDGSTDFFTSGTTGNYSVTVSQTGLCGTATSAIGAFGVSLPDALFTINGAVLSAVTQNAAYQWFLNGSPISNATANTYTATQSGSYTLQVTLNGCSSTSSAHQVVVSGIEDLSGDVALIVYPNPVNDVIKIKCNVLVPLNMEIAIQSLDGRTMLPAELAELHTGGNILECNLASLAAGIYVLHIKAEGLSQNIKLIKSSQ